MSADRTINRVCERAAQILDGIPGLRATAYPTEMPNPPEAQVYTSAFDPRMTFEGDDAKHVYALGVTVFANRQSVRSGFAVLRDFMDPAGELSIREALEDEDRWGGLIDFAQVTNIGQITEVAVGENVYLAVSFQVEACW